MQPRRDGTGIIGELERIYAEATEETISADLARARRMVDELPEAERPGVRPLVEALERLEFWLHDR